LPHLWPTGSSSGCAPIDYGPVFLRMPFGFHLTMDTLPSGAIASGGCRSALAVSGFRLRARLGFSIPSISLRPARHYPRFWIRRSSSERRRDFNPPEQCAAQRTLRVAPSLCPPRYSQPCGSTTWLSLFASGSRFPRSAREPGPRSRRLHAGRHPSSQQAPLGFIPE
jgi:hypothetical protein